LKDFWDNEYFWILCCYIDITSLITLHRIASSGGGSGESEPAAIPSLPRLSVAAFALWRNPFPRRDICVCLSSNVWNK
jgi:hypothetical protein